MLDQSAELERDRAHFNIMGGIVRSVAVLALLFGGLGLFAGLLNRDACAIIAGPILISGGLISLAILEGRNR